MDNLLRRNVLLLERRSSPELLAGGYAGFVSHQTVAPWVGDHYRKLIFSRAHIRSYVSKRIRVPDSLKRVAVDSEPRGGAKGRN